MKLIAIGDTHGHTDWKKIVEKEKDADKIVFIGDYFDSFDVPFKEQASNFNEILQLKIDHPEQVVLLLGNHDFHYLSCAKEKYSGYQAEYAHDICDVLEHAIAEELIQAAFQYGDYLFTHAGVTKTWLNSHYDVGVGSIRGTTISEEINFIFKDTPEAFRFNASNPLDNTGDSITQPPIWVRPRALSDDHLKGVHQVVGHTRMKNITIQDTVIFIDTMDHSKEYLEIVDGITAIKTA